MGKPNSYNDNDLTEVKQLGMWASIASFSYMFWLLGGMELIERMAYFGVKTTAGLYGKTPASEGGLGITMTDFGLIMGVFAIVQTFVPVLTGGLSDRFGYKETIAVSTVIKILGYLTMAWFPTFDGFMMGSILLALGTGLFRPSSQGSIVKCTTRQNSTMAWGIYYQVVNIGGFFGPLLSAHTRQLAWSNLFYACAAIVSLNLLMLLAYKEPGKEQRLERQRQMKANADMQPMLWKAALIELKKPIVSLYVLTFTGFWFMFHALFDVLPVHIDEWIDTSVIVSDLFGANGTSNGFIQFILGLNNAGTKVMPEGLLNLNAAMIMSTCFLFAAASVKYRITSSMLVGCLASCVAIMLIGVFNYAWMMVLSIALFSVGEMLIGPKKNEFLGNIAPEDKKAMYLGFVMLPQGIGWGIEGFLGPRLYDLYASKERFSLELLTERGMNSADVAAIPIGEGFTTLVSYTGEPAKLLTQLLYNNHNIGFAWYIIGIIGSFSAVGIYFYGRWLIDFKKSQL
ncbi:MAG: POT family proton-dependent oligopeptide transporter [Phenylobacterium sp.]|jgi:POT family proton-dependent oligopeptide transporter